MENERTELNATIVFAYFLVAVFTVYDALCTYAERQREVWSKPWARLTRPLKPTAEEVAAEKAAEEQRALIAHLNQDVAQYNHKTWWNEYHWLRSMNVN